MTIFCIKDLLNEWVPKGVTSEFHDFIDYGAIEGIAEKTVSTVQSRFSDYFSDHFSICYIKSFNLVTLCYLVTVSAETKSVT